MTIDYQLVFQASIPVDVFFFSSKQVYIELFLELQTLTDFACNRCTFAPSYK